MANRWICFSDAEIRELLDGPDSSSAIFEKLRRSQKRITIASAKGKGRALQQWVAARVAELLGLVYNQADDDCAIHAREMGQAGVDVILRGEARKRFPFAIECKSTESVSVPAFIRQARENAPAGVEPLVVYRSKVLREPVVMIDWSTFEKLWQGVLRG